MGNFKSTQEFKRVKPDFKYIVRIESIEVPVMKRTWYGKSYISDVTRWNIDVEGYLLADEDKHDNQLLYSETLMHAPTKMDLMRIIDTQHSMRRDSMDEKDWRKEDEEKSAKEIEEALDRLAKKQEEERKKLEDELKRRAKNENDKKEQDATLPN